MYSFKSHEVAKLLGVPKGSLYRWESAGRFPPPPRVMNGNLEEREWSLLHVKAVFESLKPKKQAMIIRKLWQDLDDYHDWMETIIDTLNE